MLKGIFNLVKVAFFFILLVLPLTSLGIGIILFIFFALYQKVDRSSCKIGYRNMGDCPLESLIPIWLIIGGFIILINNFLQIASSLITIYTYR
jgi:hypothetical protein